MIRSMTGFGKAYIVLPGKKLNIEIRSLNSKQLDLNLKLPSWLSEKEQDIRSMVGQKLERGKINLQILLEREAGKSSQLIDKTLVMNYYQEIKELIALTQDPVREILPLVLRMPDISRPSEEPIDAEQWMLVKEAVSSALEEIDAFRANEGMPLAQDLKNRVNTILKLAAKVEDFEAVRIQRIRERISQDMLNSFREGDYDSGRFEQEMIYYLERLDITEEKVRLNSHCDFFLKTLEEGGASGRKLGFISQEMGREINTLGSKANNLDIQKLVVEMKDELEKIKEQLLNIL